MAYLAHLSEHILDPLFEAVFVETGARLTVTSGYRFPKLNRAIGGASNSAHMVGRAADCKAPGIYAQKLFDIAHALRPKLPFDKLIFEHNAWIHVQIAKQGRDPRDQVWAAYKRGDDTKYESGGRPPNGKWV
ncbi:MAG: D-Ala-D-Ala carboxypeptidase family metallohydrolase [Gammaproteobacteria bacterium]